MGGLNQDQVLFDPADIAGTDSVGAFVRAGDDGDLIASQAIAGEEWLNVAAALHDGSGNALSSTGGILDVNITGGVADDDVDSGNPIKVGGRAIDQASVLTALSTTGDRGDLLMDLYRRHFTNDSPNIGIISTLVAVTDAETAMPASALAGRRDIYIQNTSTSDDVAIGGVGVTFADGFLIRKKSSFAFRAGQALPLKARADTGKTPSLRVFETA